MRPIGETEPTPAAGLTAAAERWSLDHVNAEQLSGVEAGRLLAPRARATVDEAAVIDGLLAKTPRATTTVAAPQRPAEDARAAMTGGREAGRAAPVVPLSGDVRAEAPSWRGMHVVGRQGPI